MSLAAHGHLGTSVLKDRKVNATAENGGADTLFALEVDNTQNTVDVHFKIWEALASTPTVGTTAPEWCFRIPASTKSGFVFGTHGLGINVAAANTFWFACVTEAGTAGTTNPPKDVTATLVTN